MHNCVHFNEHKNTVDYYCSDYIMEVMKCTYTHLLPYSRKFSYGANFRIIRKRAVCAKIKTFEILFSAHVGVV